MTEKLSKLVGFMLMGLFVGLLCINLCENIPVETAEEYLYAILTVGPILTVVFVFMNLDLLIK